MCVTDRDTRWSGYNNKWCYNWDGGVAAESWCVSYFRDAGNILIGTLRLDKDVRFRRSKAIIKYTTGSCFSIYIYIFTASVPPSSFFPLYLSLSCHRWNENLISIRLNCGGQHYQFKRPGDLTAPTPWWLITSQLWWALLSPLSFGCCSGGGWRLHMISAALITGLTGKRPRLHQGIASQSHTLRLMGLGKLARYMPFVYSLVCYRKVQLCQLCILC